MQNHFAIMKKFFSTNENDVMQAKEEMIELLHNFILKTLNQYYPTYLPQEKEELYQEAVCGILNGMNHYDPAKSAPTTYFKRCIIHNCTIYIDREYSHTSPYHKKNMQKVEKAREYFKEMKKEVSIEDLAAYCDLSIKVTKKALEQAKRKSEELDVNIKSGMPTPEESLLEKEKASAIKEAIGKLKPMEQNVIYLKYYREMSCAKIANEIGIEASEVRNIFNRAKKKLGKNEDLKKIVCP